VTKVTVYSTPTRPYCRMAKDYLKNRNVAFTDIDVSVDKNAAKEIVKRSGKTAAPIIDIGGKIIVGFNRPEVDKTLGL